MKKYQLGEFEEIVLLTVGVLNNNAYGVSIKQEITERLEQDCETSEPNDHKRSEDDI